jgi:hypothetical protein
VPIEETACPVTGNLISVAQCWLTRQANGRSPFVAGRHPLVYRREIEHAGGRARLWETTSEERRELCPKVSLCQMKPPRCLLSRNISRVNREADAV